MKKLVFIIACIIFSGLVFQSCNSSDKNVRDNVENVIRSYPGNVSANVNDRIVTLTGTVDSQQEKNSIENATRNVKDVKSVVNNITVRQSVMGVSMNSDDTMRSNIEARLNSEGYHNVRVSVNNGEVTLSGDVRRNDLTRVMQIANDYNPRRVNNNLNLN